MAKTKKTTTKKPTKKDLEAKIANLEAKLNKLAASTESAQTAPKPAEIKPAETKPAETKPAETAPKPAERPAAEVKPKGTLPKGTASKPAETKPAPPKPAEKAPPAPLHERFREIPTGNWNTQKVAITGYTAASDRYWGSRALYAQTNVTQSNWNDQKTKITGYTAPGNKYFATKQRLAYHPADKRFGTWINDAPKPAETKPTLSPKEAYAAEMKAKGKTLPKSF